MASSTPRRIVGIAFEPRAENDAILHVLSDDGAVFYLVQPFGKNAYFKQWDLPELPPIPGPLAGTEATSGEET